MSNGQEEIARLEAATGAFEQIITTEADSVEVPNVGPTPSLKKRVDDRFNEQYSDPVTYMQSANSDVDEYGYPLRTLYKNGDGFIAYYPEYAVFRKDGGVWVYVTPHMRKVANFNGTTQYAVASRVDEITKDNFDLEIEWRTSGITTRGTVMSQNSAANDNTGTRTLMIVMDTTGVVLIDIVGERVQFDGVPTTKSHTYTILVKNLVVTLLIDGVEFDSVVVEAPKFGFDEDADFIIGALLGGDGYRLFHKGSLFDVKIWTGGDRNTGVLTRYYPLNEGWRGDYNQVLVNYATELVELLENPYFSDGLTGWSDYNGAPLPGIINGVATGRATDRSYITQSLGTGGDGTRLYTSVATEDTVGIVTVETRLGGLGFNTGDGRTISYVETAPRNVVIVKEGSAADIMALDSLSVKKAHGYGTYNDLTEASWTQETV